MVGKSGQPFKKSRKYGESAEDLQDRGVGENSPTHARRSAGVNLQSLDQS